MSTQIQLRRDTAADWTSNDPTLAAGEQGWESDTGLRKVGDGSTAWTSLGYVPGWHVLERKSFTASTLETFASIPGTFDALHIIGSFEADSTVGAADITFNNDTTGNYDIQNQLSRGSTNTASEGFAQTAVSASSGPGGPTHMDFKLYDHANTSYDKAGLVTTSRKEGTTASDLTLYQRAFWWRSTAAITEIDFTFAQANSGTMTLLGLAT